MVCYGFEVKRESCVFRLPVLSKFGRFQKPVIQHSGKEILNELRLFRYWMCSGDSHNLLGKREARTDKTGSPIWPAPVATGNRSPPRQNSRRSVNGRRPCAIFSSPPFSFAILIQTFRTPSAGILGWTWITLMQPQKLIWGILSSLPLNAILAVATLAMVLLTSDKKKIPLNFITGLWAIFLVAITTSTIFAITPSLSWELWNRVVKVMLLGALIPILMTTPRRIHALIWITVLSLGYFGVKGGLFTLFTGHGGHVQGINEFLAWRQ